jgi:hypothetical protein
MRNFLFYHIFLMLYAAGLCAQTNSRIDSVELNVQLQNYLIDHSYIYYRDSNNKRIPYSRKEVEELYGDVAIGHTNILSDTINCNKIGIYRFGFLSLSEPRWLYLKHKKSIEFIEIEHVQNIMKQLLRFFDMYSSSFTEQEKIILVERVMKIVYDNRYAKYCW